MLMDLGPVVYVEDFEKHFLAKAAEFYQVGQTADNIDLRISCTYVRVSISCKWQGTKQLTSDSIFATTAPCAKAEAFALTCFGIVLRIQSWSYPKLYACSMRTC